MQNRKSMAGRVAVVLLVLVSLAFGALAWYVQTRVQYWPSSLEKSESNGAQLMRFTDNGRNLFWVPIVEFEGIQGDSGPLQFRACFRLAGDAGNLTSTALALANGDAVPLIAPRWFECFDAKKIGKALEGGEASAFLMQEDVVAGINRVAAVFPDGRAFAWHQVNERSFDGM